MGLWEVLQERIFIGYGDGKWDCGGQARGASSNRSGSCLALRLHACRCHDSGFRLTKVKALFQNSSTNTFGGGKDYRRLFRVTLWYNLRERMGKRLVVNSKAIVLTFTATK